MKRSYLTVMLLSFLTGLATAIAVWGQAAYGGDNLVFARFLTTAAVMAAGHCFYKVIFDRRKASYL